MIKSIELAIFTAALSLLAGCSSDYDIDFVYASAPPDDALIGAGEIRIHEGIAVGVEARPIEDGEIMERETPVHLESKNPGVLGLAFSTSSDVDFDEDDPAANWSFVIFGVKAGSTTVNVYIDGDLAGEIPAVVEPQ